MNPSFQKHILLTSVGKNGPRSTRYIHNAQSAESSFSAFGLWQLLPAQERPHEIWFLMTPTAKNSAWVAIQAEADSIGVTVKPIELSGNTDDTREFLEQTAQQIPEGCQLTLNVTEGLRHHAFLFYALALYLTTFRNVKISGAWYCRLETDQHDDPKPLIDLKPVLDLAQWFHALAVFRETGSLRQVAERMPNGEARDLVEQLSFFFLNGMPVEAGNVASRIVNLPGQQLVREVPLSHELRTTLIKVIQPMVGPEFDAQPNSTDRRKRSLQLSESELSRQGYFIDRYFETGQYNLAFGLLREWLVNWLALRSDQNVSWLERSARESLEHNLGGLSEVLKAKAPGDPKRKRYKHSAVRDGLTNEQIAWAKRWGTVCDIRNALQHHGMKPAVFEPHRNDITKAREDWEQHTTWVSPSQFGGGGGRLLICPIGLTPGVLYSALQHTNPSHAIVICSQQSESAIHEAVAHSGWKADLLLLRMEDIHRGVTEFDLLIDQASKWLFSADQVVANLTGGTTLMGVLVTRLIARARREYQRQVHEFVLIDPRSPEQQRDDPWKLGDIHYLDGEPDGNEPSGNDESTSSGEAPQPITEKNA